MVDFTHLHVHTDRSALDSIIKPSELVNKTRELGMSAVAITDHGVMAAAIQFYKEALKEEDNDRDKIIPIKPIIGIEFYISPTDDHTLQKSLEGHPKQQCYHLTALAKNEVGVSQLYQLSSIGFLEGFYYKPRVSLKLIEEIGKDLILLGACAKGPVCWNIMNDNFAAAEKWLDELRDRFAGRFYLEFMDHGLDFQHKINRELNRLSKRFEIPWVPTNDVHFLVREDHYIHSIMMCLQTKSTLDNLQMRYPEECYLKSPQEMIQLFGQEACKRTMEIAEQVDIELSLGTAMFPEYKEGLNRNDSNRVNFK